MGAIEFLGSNGELFNVAEGKTVELTIPLGNDQLGSEPAEIPLWYFDETYKRPGRKSKGYFPRR